ncbi:putative uncharacterized protein DDB_G0287265 [Clytia hemisphaerica]|uniref:Uncharacterized protein n=1 Tax=Clytia hemisphaerica TaxID=252671 RepID=A0A7M5X9K6_9CNID
MLFRKKHCWHRKNKDGTVKYAMEGRVNQNGTQNNNITTQNGHAPKIILPRGSLFANQDPKMEPGNSIINNQGKVSPRPSINERLEPRDVGTFQESYINEPEGVAPNEPIYMDPPDLYNMVKELENQSSDTDQIQKTKETPPQCDQQVRPDDCKNQMIDESTTSHPYNCIGEEETPKNHESLAPEDPNDSHPYNRLDLDIKNTRINDRPEIKPPNDYNGLINPIYHKVDDPNTIPLSPVINYSGDNEGTIGGIDNGNGDKHYEITLAENEEDDKNAIGNISTNENDADNKHYEISLDENEGDNDDNEDHNNGANKHYEISLAGIDGDNENFEYDSIDEDDDVGNKNNELNNADKIGKISPVHEFSSDEGSKTLLGSMERKKEELYVDLEDPEDDDLYEVSPKDVE